MRGGRDDEREREEERGERGENKTHALLVDYAVFSWIRAHSSRSEKRSLKKMKRRADDEERVR